MALLKFLKLDPAKKRLPHPSGLLSSIIPSSSIATANEEVKTIVTAGEDKKEQGLYVKFSSKAKLVIARYAAENGIAVSQKCPKAYLHTLELFCHLNSVVCGLIEPISQCLH